MPDKQNLSRALRTKAEELGFDLFGIAPAGLLADDTLRFRKWIEMGHYAGMDYMTRNFEKRMNPSLVLENAKSVIVTGINYYRGYNPVPRSPIFSRYAFGEDYHIIVKTKLHKLLDYLKEYLPDVTGKICVDSVPLKENVWAQKAGLGWIGKNSLLINSKAGSYFFLGEIVTSAELGYNEPETRDQCGDCRRCIESCPTGAINHDRTLNAGRCISYLTIEHRGEFPDSGSLNLHNRVFGCDICQEVCPWNRKARESSVNEFNPKAEILEYTYDQWDTVDEEQFNRIFSNSALERTGYEGFKRNLSKLIRS